MKYSCQYFTVFGMQNQEGILYLKKDNLPAADPGLIRWLCVFLCSEHLDQMEAAFQYGRGRLAMVLDYHLSKV